MRAWFWNCLLFTALLACRSAQAEMRLPALINDGMVLERSEKVRIRRWAAPGENVEVTIAGRRTVVRTDAYGRWVAILKPLKSQGPF